MHHISRVMFLIDPHNILVTPRTLGDVKEGSDVLLCQLTNPIATDLSVRMANGDPTPPDMNYTVNPKRGILIRYLLTSHSADYVCSAKINGVTKVSKVVPIFVIQSEMKLMSVHLCLLNIEVISPKAFQHI